MAIPYVNIIKTVMVRTGQMGDGVSAAAIDAIFAGPVATAWEGTDLPLTALKLQVLSSEKSIVQFLAKLDNPICLGELMGRTRALVDGDTVPTEDEAGSSFIGNFLSVKDDATEEELTEKPKQEIRRLKRFIAEGLLPAETYHYCRSGQTVNHTRTEVYFEGLAWSYEHQSDQYDAVGGLSPLAVELETMFTAHVLSNIAIEDWFAQEAQAYAGVLQMCKQDLASGVIPSSKMPDTTADQEPVKN